MPSFTYLPGHDDPETVQTHGLSFTAGEGTPVPDDHAALAKLRANRFFAEQGKATNGNISVAESLPANEENGTQLHDSGSAETKTNQSFSKPVPAPVDLSPAQCRAARAGLEWSREQLAKAAKLGERTITDFERGASTMLAPNTARLCAALEAAGVTFEGSNGIWLPSPQNGAETGEGNAIETEGEPMVA
jgi:hypothetical protein